MLGSIIKYTAVALAGAVCFATFGHFMDADVVEAAKVKTEDYAATLGHATPEEFREKMRAFISVNRDAWVKELTFASSISDLDAALMQWR